jgi:hypothetical protein
MGGTVRSSNPGRDKRFVSSVNLPGRFWGPFNLLFNDYRRSLQDVRRPGCEVDHYLPLPPRLRMHGAITLLAPYTLSMAWTATTLPFYPAEAPRIVMSEGPNFCQNLGYCNRRV